MHKWGKRRGSVSGLSTLDELNEADGQAHARGVLLSLIMHVKVAGFLTQW